MTDPIVIIGGGVGGLSTAIRLASQGQPVTLLEKNATVGGKMAEHKAQGYRWDIGPSVITMRHVFADLFASAGRRLEDYLNLLPVDPLTRYFYPDGTRLDASSDLSQMTARIADLWERDVEGYLKYLAYAAFLHRVTGPVFIYDKPPTWRSFLQVTPADAWRVDALKSMYGKIRHYVRSPYLRQLLARFATYTGSNPYLASSTLNVIAFVELSGGVWYPQGGIITIAEALARLAGEWGVEIYTETEVHEIALRQRRAVGVITKSGETIPASAVIANVDVSHVYQHLLPPTAITRRQRQISAHLDPSCSGFILLLGLEGTSPDLAHHNIFFSADYESEFTDIFHRGIPPQDPTLYVSITAKTDPDHAPAGHENWFVLVNAPALSPQYDWQGASQDYGDLVLDQLKRFGHDVRPRLRYARLLTPTDLAKNTAAWRGTLYGMSLNSPFAPFRRPSNRAPDVDGLYFVGGTTHPGGGVPMVMLSAKVVQSMLREDGIIQAMI